jgi:serine/threonine protein phosphatase 1
VQWKLKLKKYLSNLFKKTPPLQPFLPANTRVYCIGDIHGCNDLLLQLLAKISQDKQGFNGKVVIVYLGDFIDRGPHSKQVIDTLLEHEQLEIDYVYLRGNHEQTLLDCLENPALITTWLSYGGLPALASYQVVVNKIPTKLKDLLDIQKQLQEKLPRTHYDFFLNTQLSYTLGAYFFVHAGIYPRRSLARQQAQDLLWIRDEFILCVTNYEKIIVHGHTITEEPQLLSNRIGIDTGAFSSGKLTCLVLEADQQRILLD